MATINDLINSLAQKAGIQPDNQGLKDLLTNAELSKVTVAPELATAIESNLLTMDSAKNNSVLKAHYFAQSLNGVDSEVGRIMDESGLDDTTKAEILAEKSTPKRVVLLTQKIKALEEAKSGATGKGDKVELQNAINALNAEKSTLIKDHAAVIERIQGEHQGQMTSMMVKNTLSTYNYALGDLPPEIKLDTAFSVIQKALQSEGAKVISENGTLRLVTNDGTDYYDKQQNKRDFSQFVEATLAQNKLLKTAEGGSGNGATPQQNATLPGSQSGARVNSDAMAALDAQIAAAQH